MASNIPNHTPIILANKAYHHLTWHRYHTSGMASHYHHQTVTYESSNHSKDISSKHIISSLKALHVHFRNTQSNNHVHLYHQSKTINAWTLQMYNLPLITLQQLNTSSIMHEHVNTCSYHSNNKTLILTCKTKQAIKNVKHKLSKHKNMGKESKQNKHVKAEAKQIKQN